MEHAHPTVKSRSKRVRGVQGDRYWLIEREIFFDLVVRKDDFFETSIRVFSNKRQRRRLSLNDFDFRRLIATVDDDGVLIRRRRFFVVFSEEEPGDEGDENRASGGYKYLIHF